MGSPPGTLSQKSCQHNSREHYSIGGSLMKRPFLEEPWPGNSEGVQVVFKPVQGHLLSAYSMPNPILGKVKDVSIRFNLHLQ